MIKEKYTTDNPEVLSLESWEGDAKFHKDLLIVNDSEYCCTRGALADNIENELDCDMCCELEEAKTKDEKIAIITEFFNNLKIHPVSAEPIEECPYGEESYNVFYKKTINMPEIKTELDRAIEDVRNGEL